MASILKISTVGCALAFGLMASGGARARDVAHGSYGYGHTPVQAVEYGYGGPAIRGDYVGAPFTRFPRPTELVPSAWGYGTYGVPTVAGIRPASIGTPTVYVIDSPPRTVRQTRAAASPRILSRSRDGRWSRSEGGAGAQVASHAGPRVVSVKVGHGFAMTSR